MRKDNNNLLVDFCSYEAAKFAVLNWHYSKRMPVSKLVKLGVWENDFFIGCVIFAHGANNAIGKPYGLAITEVSELVRVALDKHIAPVSKILSIAIKKIKLQSPNLKLLVSFADSEQSHHGGIYQAGNWIYNGCTIPADEYIIDGRRYHGRALRSIKPSHVTTSEYVKSLNGVKIKGSFKYRYLYPLTRSMRKKVLLLSKPYPKRNYADG